MADFNVTVYTTPYGIPGPAGTDGALSSSGVITFNGFTGNLQGVSSWNGKTGALVGVCSINGLVETVGLSGGLNISIATNGNTLAISTTNNVATVDTSQTFSAAQTFNNILVPKKAFPSSSSDSGTAGTVIFGTDGNLYYCVGSGNWKKFTSTTF